MDLGYDSMIGILKKQVIVFEPFLLCMQLTEIFSTACRNACAEYRAGIYDTFNYK